MIRVSAPGLSPWPPLLFDPDKRRAVVSARVVHWRSIGWGKFATECLIWIINGVSVVIVWSHLGIDEVGLRIAFSILGGLMIGSFASQLLRTLAPEALARQFFASRLTIWFSEEAIAFRSRYYDQPVVIWRSWQGQPVKTQFHMQPDDEAKAFASQLEDSKRLTRNDVEEAVCIELVLSMLCQTATSPIGQQETILRSLPIAPVQAKDVIKIVMVLTAAATLTAPKPHPLSGYVRPGFDIDMN
ncbi:hypothetical protein [Blastopirellula marina]|uniref:hypothetical protein n=1 Tax=Blastopirellula marina TaxID=124 RepID=UPI0002DAFB2D|nr:hypothetical protein [Blastopirellula marina]